MRTLSPIGSLFYSLFLFLLFVTVNQAQNYGSLCDDDGGGGGEYPSCSAELFLECNMDSGTCDCAEDSLFDGFICRLMATESCSPVPGSQPCVMNAACVEDTDSFGNHSCICTPGFNVNSRGRCFLPHDASCDHEPDNCDPDEWQQCSVLTDRCECKNRDLASYNSRERTCQLLVNSPCLTPIPDDLDQQPCFTNSACSRTQGRCECLSGYEVTGDRKCFVPYGRPCIGDGACNVYDGWQECERVCRCANTTESVYNAQTETCQLLHGASCGILDSSQPCVLQNSQCNEQSRTCTCAVGLVEDEQSRFCFVPYGGVCDPDGTGIGRRDLCNRPKYMECDRVSEVCACTHGTEAVLDTVDGVCKLKANALCARDGQPCVRDAACEAFGGATPLRCQCRFDLESNAERVCRLGHGRPCSTFNNKCDALSNLVCNPFSEQCVCHGQSFFDQSAGTCRAFLGTPCSVDDQCPIRANCHLSECVCDEEYGMVNPSLCAKGYGITCNSSAEPEECNVEANLQCIGGRCMCKSGFVEDEEADDDDNIKAVKCRASYQSTCNETIECSVSAGLRCFFGRCNCLVPGDQLFQDTRCGSLVGKRCHLNPTTNPNALRCVKNAVCSEASGEVDDPTVYGLCTCEEGYRLTLTYTCIEGDGSGGRSRLVGFSIVTLAIIVMLVARVDEVLTIDT